VVINKQQKRDLTSIKTPRNAACEQISAAKGREHVVQFCWDEWTRLSVVLEDITQARCMYRDLVPPNALHHHHCLRGRIVEATKYVSQNSEERNRKHLTKWGESRWRQQWPWSSCWRGQSGTQDYDRASKKKHEEQADAHKEEGEKKKPREPHCTPKAQTVSHTNATCTCCSACSCGCGCDESNDALSSTL
jgi:hypothetical protein